MQHMQLSYAEGLVPAFRKLFRHLVRHSSDSTLVHDHTSRFSIAKQGRQGVLVAVASSANQVNVERSDAAACRGCTMMIEGMSIFPRLGRGGEIRHTYRNSFTLMYDSGESDIASRREIQILPILRL